MTQFNTVPSSQLSIGMRFSRPLFFDDGKNMFLAQGKAIKPYHIAALSRWNIDSVLTSGHQLSEQECALMQESSGSVDDMEELDEAEEVEALEEVEEI